MMRFVVRNTEKECNGNDDDNDSTDLSSKQLSWKKYQKSPGREARERDDNGEEKLKLELETGRNRKRITTTNKSTIIRIKWASKAIKLCCQLLFFLLPVLGAIAFTIVKDQAVCDNGNIGCQYTTFDLALAISSLVCICVLFPLSTIALLYRPKRRDFIRALDRTGRKNSAWAYFIASNFRVEYFWMRHVIRFSLVMIAFCNIVFSDNFYLGFTLKMVTLLSQLGVIWKLKDKLYYPNCVWKRAPRIALLVVSMAAIILGAVATLCEDCKALGCNTQCEPAVYGLAWLVICLMVMLFVFIAYVFVRVLYVGAKEEDRHDSSAMMGSKDGDEGLELTVNQLWAHGGPDYVQDKKTEK